MPVRAETLIPKVLLSDDESLCSIESDVSDLAWEEAFQKTNLAIWRGKICGNDGQKLVSKEANRLGRLPKMDYQNHRFAFQWRSASCGQSSICLNKECEALQPQTAVCASRISHFAQRRCLNYVLEVSGTRVQNALRMWYLFCCQTTLSDDLTRLSTNRNMGLRQCPCKDARNEPETPDAAQSQTFAQRPHGRKMISDTPDMILCLKPMAGHALCLSYRKNLYMRHDTVMDMA
jgi:hypothetical protein